MSKHTGSTRARIDLHHKAENELYKLENTVKAEFYDFCHKFRQNPDQPGLDLKQLKGDSRIWRAKVTRNIRALMIPVGAGPNARNHWLVIAVRPRKEVYEQLQVAINRVTGEIEFVDLAVVGDTALRRAGITLTPAEPEKTTPTQPEPDVPNPEVAVLQPLLAGVSAEQLGELGVAEQLIPLALAVVTEDELDDLLRGAPMLSKDVLYGLASGMPLDEVRAEITSKVSLDRTPDLDDLASAVERTKITTVDDDLRQVVEEGDFRAWKVFLHPTQKAVVEVDFSGPARVTGGPGTGKTIVALHRVNILAQRLAAQATPGAHPILLTTFTANLAADLRSRLSSLMTPELRELVDVMHIDQLAARITGENSSRRPTRKRVDDQAALREMKDLVAEVGHDKWTPEFLFEEWDQIILGHSVTTRSEYFQVRRSGRGRGVTRTERAEIWKIVDQFTARMDKLGIETWGQAAERAARYEMARAAQVEQLRAGTDEVQDGENSSGARARDYRYQHVVIDEAQDLRAAHWKLLRALVAPSANDLFIAGDTHQRIYDHQVTLGALGISVRGRRSQRLTLSYRTTREILAHALAISDDTSIDYDDLDDGRDTLAGYRSILHGPRPTFVEYDSWEAERAGLAATLETWRQELKSEDRDPTGRIAVCVAEHGKVGEVISYLSSQENLTCAELTKDGVKGSGMIHVGTMHRFKGLEYERLAVVGVSEGIMPRRYLERFRDSDPERYERELRKARSLLFVAVTRARDSLAISWHGQRSHFLPKIVEG
ncbi:UvrD-helicase domain-containing protein [Kineosporia babensis]|uniref:DNA 3'-5' helicase n=1 Tax=Kineosporia babensis TaxID=499548 RepID=A0A9X1NNN9_9ACTN|nr:UvrD-helicase domain-containing protein [Kineosporia babensis]MCD5317099.1 AAA family ATPase [Kineosporia babensis]